MKIILLKKVKGLGNIDDIKDVSDGYARNFLLPRGMAQIATDEAVKNAQIKNAQKKASEEARLTELQELAKKLKNKKIILKSKEKNGKLFGSITAKSIAQKLQEENLEISQDCIILKETIKKIGSYPVKISLDSEIETEINLEVVPEK